MKQSMEFDDILNECLERVLHGETVGECLSRYPQYAGKLKPLLETGLQVRRAASVQPRPEFRTNARLQFEATLNTAETKPKVSFLYWLKQPQWAAVTAFALLVVLGTTTGVLANGSMPDQPLYPVKLAMEKIQISLTPSPESRGELYARLLERRLDEITMMAEQNKSDKLPLVTTQLDAMVSGIASLTTAKAESFDARNAAPATVPPQAAPTAPPGIAATAPPLAGAAGVAAPAENATLAAAPVTQDGATPTMLDNAAADLSRLRNLLASVPESQRPALQDAIIAAENTYAALLDFVANK